MKFASNAVRGLSMSAGALIAAVSLSVHPGNSTASVEAAPAGPVHSSPAPPPPPPPPTPAMTYDPNQDYWSGQGSGGGAPGGAGGGAGGGG
ncbi:hypothetical protein [Mycobacterium cookii]|uniref:hypothetical protein n=1 Tax=Mycobacterium cookii TaxID=1775 RepID=UPI0013D3DD5D|nr:hypothetical protein [Mycobacterium cookii]MCV7329373.1 hypothetical protein [Mycobacterium cookii]